MMFPLCCSEDKRPGRIYEVLQGITPEAKPKWDKIIYPSPGYNHCSHSTIVGENWEGNSPNNFGGNLYHLVICYRQKHGQFGKAECLDTIWKLFQNNIELVGFGILNDFFNCSWGPETFITCDLLSQNIHIQMPFKCLLKGNKSVLQQCFCVSLRAEKQLLSQNNRLCDFTRPWGFLHQRTFIGGILKWPLRYNYQDVVEQ